MLIFSKRSELLAVLRYDIACYASSETQGQLFGSIKVDCKIETSPRTLNLPEPVPEAIGQNFFFLANQRRGVAG